MEEERKDILFMYKYYGAKLNKYLASRKRMKFGLAQLKELHADDALTRELQDIIDHIDVKVDRIEKYLAILEKNWGMGKKKLEGQKNFSY